MTTVALEYIGKNAMWVDNAYGSNITFEKGEIYKLPHHIAMQLLVMRIVPRSKRWDDFKR